MKEQALPEGWRKVRLGDIYDISAGGDFKPQEASAIKNEKYPYPIYSNALTNKGLYGYSTYSKYKENSITVTARGDIGTANHRKTKFVAVGRLLVLKNKIPISNKFVCMYINHKLKFFKETTGVPQLTAPQAGRYHIIIPSLPEQKAIASLLETWDTAIEKTEALIAAKQKQFEWLVKILIEKNQYESEWQRNTLDNLFEIYTYSSKSKSVSNQGGLFIVDMGAVSRKGDLIANKRTNNDADILQVHDLVMPKDDIGGGNIIGKVAIIEDEDKYICSDHVYRLVPKSKNNTYFIRFLINSFSINRKLRAKANGTSQLGLSKRDVASQQIWLPLIIKQNAIAQVLNTAQQEISLLKQLAEQYRMQKQGLMQKLLTGQWRLN